VNGRTAVRRKLAQALCHLKNRQMEQLCSLARLVESLSKNAWENASLSLLERTLDDSANRRIYIPEMFLAIDEMLTSANAIISGLIIHQEQVKNNLNKYAPFVASEGILMEAIKKGADRQQIHETLREISMTAWTAVQKGEPNPMKSLLKKDITIKKYFSEKEIETLLDVSKHIGTAPKRAKKLITLLASV
jgi:adenylosuccinate lyase